MHVVIRRIKAGNAPFAAGLLRVACHTHSNDETGTRTDSLNAAMRSLQSLRPLLANMPVFF